MTLREALAIAGHNSRSGLPQDPLFLACGFMPLHLRSFLTAHLAERSPGRQPILHTGLYGDLPGNLSRALEAGATTAVIVEWADLDPRLGIRHAGGWTAASRSDIAETVARQLATLAQSLAHLQQRCLVALIPPTLPLPPLGHERSAQASSLHLQLRCLVDEFLKRCSELPNLRIGNLAQLDQSSPPAARFDAKTELYAGFPYSLTHAAAVAGLLTGLLYPPPPKKGLILDLDNTLWSGIVGEIGSLNVCWNLESKAQIHGLLQQVVAALAENGVLLAIASKNNPEVVAEALQRPDMLVCQAAFFPLEINWQPKSASVGRILRAWNIAADSVVFLDDSPMELAEVKARYPTVECLQFTPADVERAWQTLWTLKDLFGKPSLQAEDRLRSASLRAGAELEREIESQGTGFLSTLQGTVTLNFRKQPDTRAFELVNKTNQFNLNGRRYTEQQWQQQLEDPAGFLVRVSYTDKFGPLGTIAVLSGQIQDQTVLVHTWVMSCRSFSRQIEHHTLDRLLAHFGTGRITFDYRATDRNSPLTEFFQTLAENLSDGFISLDATQLRQIATFPHRVEEIGSATLSAVEPV